ncbi:Predicted arabinose efflux permease, MFS family [Terribacillus halophilus]|uniref:Predicted arabinose efflux permease, MFS family n=1 Tax=Terribacillus halophilus TaxID=361279 RepID=A0A1G6J6C6_9BACI|nr:Predicted arabinose efflux permease, MFS family [Terribacillus halophilus]
MKNVSGSKLPTKNTLWTLSFILVVISNALLFMIFEMLLPTLPLFVNEIGGNAGAIGLITGVFMVSAILIRPFSGYLLRIVNKKYLLILGILINAVSTGLYYYADSVSLLLIIRIIHGAGFGLASTYFATLAAEIIPKDRRGEGLGYFGVGETVAISIGPMIGIAILNVSDYSRLFLGGMAVLILSAFMAILSKKSTELKRDVQEHQTIKIIEMRVLFPSLLILMAGLAASGIMSFLSLYALEKDFNGVGWFFFVVAATSFLVRLISGKLFDKHGPSIILIPGSILAFLGFIVLYFAESAFFFYIAAALYGLGFGAIFPAIQTWCISLVQEHEHEYAMSTFFNFFDIGIGGGSL